MTTATGWRLDLPFPTPPLRDNGRYHWAAKARVTRELREQAGWLAHLYRLPRGLPFVTITLCWLPAVQRRRDPLSISPTLKPLVDGLVDYGLVPDDDIGHVRLGCDIRPSVARGSSRCWLDIVAPGGDAVSRPLTATQGDETGRVGTRSRDGLS